MTPTIMILITLGGLIALLAYWLATDDDCGDFGEND
jgi:hypothetical protein